MTREELRLLRLYLGLTLLDIAKFMNCTKQTISNIENGKSTSTMTLLFYKKTLLHLLYRNLGLNYDEYLKQQILTYTRYLDNYSHA